MCRHRSNSTIKKGSNLMHVQLMICSDKHNASSALPVWNLLLFLDISPMLSPLKSPHCSHPELFLPHPNFSSPIQPTLQICDLDPSLDPSFLLSLSYYGPLEIVFASPVQSGFLPPKWATIDCNQSRTDPDIAGTEPDHLGLVFCSPWN